MEGTRTRGRICHWYDEHGNVVELTLDVWDQDHELVTTMVAEIGPFDDWFEVRDEMWRCLTAQGTLF